MSAALGACFHKKEITTSRAPRAGREGADMSNRNMRFTPVERQWPRPFSDRAAIVATTIMQIVADVSHKPAELRLRIAEYLRDEIANIEQEIAADRREIHE
jgi:hypothetical protein